VAQEQNHQNWLDIHEGDADAWREFLSREIPQLYDMFMKRWPNPSLAEELVQNTVTRLRRKMLLQFTPRLHRGNLVPAVRTAICFGSV